MKRPDPVRLSALPFARAARAQRQETHPDFIFITAGGMGRNEPGC